MSGWAEIKRPFRDALINANNWHELKQVLDFHCDRRLDLITSQSVGFEQNVDDVIANAVEKCWLEKLARGALAENKSHAGLNATVPIILDGIENVGISYYKPPPTGPSGVYFEPAMVRIPEGEFLMGSNDESHYSEEKPRHLVRLPAYSISIYPITNELFYHYLNETGHVATSAMRWDGNKPHDDREQHPVVGVTWEEAQEYCMWLSQETCKSYHLPTEAQWEKAARGESGRLYPWGNRWEEKRCNSLGKLTAVDAFPAQNEEYGCFDMVGNAREWTVTAWGQNLAAPDKRYAYPWREDGRNSPNLPSTIMRVYRGGRHTNPLDCRCSARCGWPPTDPGLKSNPIGFRVVCLLE
jgi:formylglycine-generating enzyme required for sulfatase activity